MTSLFGNTGNQNQAQSSGTGLFGGGQPQGGGLFGSSAPQSQGQQQGTGLFGSSTTQNQQQGTNLFGGATNTQNQNTGTTLFGNNTNQQAKPSGGGLFGVTTNQQQSGGTSLFGSNNNQQPQGTGLFGSTANQNQPQPQQGGTGLFGSTQQPRQQGGTGLFGNSQPPPAQAAPSGGLFGTQQQQQQQPPNPSGSLFPQSVPQRTYAERTFNNPQQTHLSSLLQSGLGANPSAFGALAATSQTDLARSRLAASGIYANTNEKNTVEQIQTLVRKWDPSSQETLLQAYLYNAVNSAYAPFYHRNPGESEREWEEALAKKPAPIENKDGDNVSFVPVLVRGFKELGERVQYQARTLNELRSRLHEMNNSLNAIMSTHQQGLTVRLENARRQHTVLSQRCLRLAVKAQILRNRGYPLDGAEESLRKSLLSLSDRTFDPQYAAREEEIWARMVALRDRARWLEEEGKRVSAEQAAGSTGGGQGGKEVMSEEVVAKAKKILADYEGQIRHLGRELEEVKREYEEWSVQRR